MIDLTNEKNAADRLTAICRNSNTDRGQMIAYAKGDYSSLIGCTPIGRSAMDMFNAGKVHLFQKRISDEPREYLYLAVVK